MRANTILALSRDDGEGYYGVIVVSNDREKLIARAQAEIEKDGGRLLPPKPDEFANDKEVLTMRSALAIEEIEFI